MSNLAANYWNKISDEYFKGYYESDDLLHIAQDPTWAFPRPIFQLISELFPDLRGKRVLVPSSGYNDAVFAFHLLGASVTSADISERQLYNAKRIADSKNWDITFVQADSADLSCLDGDQFDLVYTSNGAHVWISDLTAMYSHFNRLLRKNGSYIMFETHPFIRPFGDDEKPVITVSKPYEQTGPFGNVPTYHWRIQDLINNIIKSGFSLRHIEEFHPEINDSSLWFYKTKAEAEADRYKRFDWKINPWAVLPQWIGISADKIN